MENNTKKVGAGSSSSSSSSSSITLDLFGPKDSSSSSSTTTTGRFGSVFPPPSTVLRRETGSLRHLGKHGTSGYNTENKNWESNGMTSKDKSSVYQNQTVDHHPCYFSSSIYYGGQEVYSPQTSRPAQSHPIVNFKKDGGEDDQNGSNSNSASRGNWWQGSLYY